MNIPKLIFIYAYPLDQNRRRLFKDKDFGDYPTIEVVQNQIDEWEKLWDTLEKDHGIMNKLITLIGITPPRDFEIYMFGRGLNPMSNPLIMPIMKSEGKVLSNDQFIEIIIHELIHRFIQGKFSKRIHPGAKKYWNMIGEKYKEENILIQHHILVYAILKEILEDVFGKDKLKDFLKPKHPDYQRALRIAQEKDPTSLIEEFRTYIRV